MKYFKNKFFIILLATALFLSTFGIVTSAMGIDNSLNTLVNTIASPLQKGITTIKQSLEGFVDYFSSVDKLLDENDRLQSENEELESQLNEYILAKQENDRLREYLEMEANFNNLELKDALIIGHGSENHMNTFTLNCGKNDGIELGMAVMTSLGVVGTVSEVSTNTCKVRTIIESTAGVGAYVVRTGDTGVVQGNIEYKDSSMCDMMYLEDDSDIVEGDLVYTSGLGTIYPRDLPIGRVVSVDYDEYNRMKVAKIQTMVDFSDLEFVVIIKSFSQGMPEQDTTEQPQVEN